MERSGPNVCMLGGEKCLPGGSREASRATCSGLASEGIGRMIVEVTTRNGICAKVSQPRIGGMAKTATGSERNRLSPGEDGGTRGGEGKAAVRIIVLDKCLAGRVGTICAIEKCGNKKECQNPELGG